MVPGPEAIAAAGRLRMLKEDKPIVWDETVEALTDLGAFEVLSGVEPEIRPEEYYRLKQQWLDIAERLGEDADFDSPAKGDDPDADMYRDAVVRVDKDVHRTDRGHPFYARDLSNHATPEQAVKRPPGVGPGTPNMNKLRDILITYACSYPGSDRLGFVQGMADLASPILIALEGDESDAFWCFANLMDKMKANFRHDGLGMRTRLTTLSSLLRLTDPHLHVHLELTGAGNLFCCFRWFLVLFKREFGFEDILRLWEVLASGWAGDEFEYFVALAILDEHRDAIVRHLMTFDEILKYVNDLSGTIPIDPILEAAELLYLRFRVRAASVGAITKSAIMGAGASHSSGARNGKTIIPAAAAGLIINHDEDSHRFDEDEDDEDGGVMVDARSELDEDEAEALEDSPGKKALLASSPASARSFKSAPGTPIVDKFAEEHFNSRAGRRRSGGLPLGELVEKVIAAEEMARAAVSTSGKRAVL
ncbi:GTPase activating protein [Phlyctochytrium bullatum]|nr:GTPase activating protein [Phlyctochytrium bullatum]